MNENGVNILWLVVAFFLVVFALLTWIWSQNRRYESGLPPGEIIYSDHGTWLPQKEALYSAQYQLVGRPDYLVLDETGNIVPVEIKSGIAPSEPHEGHILQLAAYCLLVDQVYENRPSHGILQYRDKAFAVTYSDELEDDLIHLLTEMRDSMFEDELDRDHDEWVRCERCGVREYCRQRLA